MRSFDVRRLAAVDMWGFRGTRLRRRLILAEFVLGAVGGVAPGVWLVGRVSDWVGWLIVAWLIGVGLDDAALAVHAISLSQAGALERELAGLDVPAELRHYTTAQFRVVVPFWVALLTLAQGRPAGGDR